MRSTPLMAAGTFILAAAWACGGGGTDVGNPPAASFTQQCTGLACNFNDSSTPTSSITSWSWDFNDPNSGAANNASTVQNPTHTFSAAGTYNVKLTVGEASGASNSKTNPVTVTGTANQPPVASFDLPTCTAGTPCGFHSTSTDPDGSIASSHWDFGDQGTADTPDATHTYAAAGSFNVALTVTDDKGGTNTSTQAITVSPTSSQGCTTSATHVDCSLGMNQKVTVKFTLISHSCELTGNRLSITAPVPQTVFFNLCNQTDGKEYTVQDGSGTGAPLVFQAGSELAIRFTQGVPGPGDPATGDPGIKIQGSFPNWILNIDDGGAAAAPGEPDFNDAILSVQATPAP